MRIPRSDVNALKLFRYFKKKYLIGEIGLLCAICVSALKVKNVRPFSLMIVAPSGQMKSTMLNDILKIFDDHTTLMPSRFTPFGVSTKIDVHKLNEKTWVINDMVRTFDGLSGTKIAELVGFMAELMSEGKADSSTALSTALSVDMNLIGCIPTRKYRDVKDVFLSSTFSERILQFQYIIKKSEVRKKGKSRLKWETGPIQLASGSISISRKLKNRLYLLSDSLTSITHYEKESLRPDEIVLSFLSGYALLNNRTKIRKADLDIFEHYLPYFKRMI